MRTKTKFNVYDFVNCCGLKIMHSFAKMFNGETYDEFDETLRNTEKDKLRLNNSMYPSNKGYNSCILILNNSQNEAFGKALEENGYEMIRKFKNWNEKKQPLYMYFKEGSWDKE